MSYSEAQKRDAYLEAQHILRLDKKWQQLMPGERKPNFRRAAREIVRRALGQKVRRNQAPLMVHSGLMHEHDAREAALIERTLKNGMYDPSILHSFQLGSKESRHDDVRDEKPKLYPSEVPEQDFEVYVHDHGAMAAYPSHFEPGTGLMHSSVHEPPEDAEVPSKIPAGTTMESDHHVVH